MNAIGVPPIAFWRVTQPSAHFGGRHRISGRSCLRHDIVQGQEVERAFGAGATSDLATRLADNYGAVRAHLSAEGIFRDC